MPKINGEPAFSQAVDEFAPRFPVCQSLAQWQNKKVNEKDELRAHWTALADAGSFRTQKPYISYRSNAVIERRNFVNFRLLVEADNLATFGIRPLLRAQSVF